ncbi:hypothetical protein L596_028578 [Steinernema carpocapsae]|uniref:Secreted protein n=1 Tax=Steinernema carpocapsae TaxID=34508 RepID=A0A4U5LYU0_STECR|nr:hypothetical protein L596_028578 [Steinernema carpocapsae]
MFPKTLFAIAFFFVVLATFQQNKQRVSCDKQNCRQFMAYRFMAFVWLPSNLITKREVCTYFMPCSSDALRTLILFYVAQTSTGIGFPFL